MFWKKKMTVLDFIQHFYLYIIRLLSGNIDTIHLLTYENIAAQKDLYLLKNIACDVKYWFLQTTDIAFTLVSKLLSAVWMQKMYLSEYKTYV